MHTVEAYYVENLRKNFNHFVEIDNSTHTREQVLNSKMFSQLGNPSLIRNLY